MGASVELGWMSAVLALAALAVPLVLSQMMFAATGAGGGAAPPLLDVRGAAVAAARAAVQLTCLASVLVPVFARDAWWLTLLTLSAMTLIATSEATGRSPYRFPGMRVRVMASMGATAVLLASWALGLVLRVGLEARYAIPITGMLLGNATSAVSVGLAALLKELAESPKRVEALLVLGATRWEATLDVMSSALRLATTPVVNQMRLIGLVSIPGMMTGQLLGGTAPAQAALYQAVIIYLISAMAMLTVALTALQAVEAMFDSLDRLRPERLTPRSKEGFAERAYAALRERLVRRPPPTNAAADDDGDDEAPLMRTRA
mmetsp:Transcript_12050/g.39638  ORF Transcript_12050/g.39638 Transcript_12050/m.39638 type:complete len:318 (+) Transcript_12050:808-1761(+)